MKIGDEVHVKQSDGQVCDKRGWRYKYKWSDRKARIMAIEEGYAMLRFKNCMPFVKRLDAINQSNNQETK